MFTKSDATTETADREQEPRTSASARSRLRFRAQALADGPVGDWWHRRQDEVDTAIIGGWSLTAWWLRAVVIGGGLAFGLYGLALVLTTTSDATHQIHHVLAHTTIGSQRGTLLAVITAPVHHYLAVRTAALPVSPRLAFDAWSVTGVALGVAAWKRSGAGRIGWAMWGAASAGMVWAGTPAASQALATGEAALAWALLSLAALRGLRSAS